MKKRDARTLTISAQQKLRERGIKMRNQDIWLAEDYPIIEKQSKEENAEIQWADETACVSLPSVIKGYAPKGKTPGMKHTALSMKHSTFNSITPTQKSEFYFKKS